MKDFEALGLSLPVLKALKQMGFEAPTEIQTETIPHLLADSGDLIGLAQTGTGKTAAFGLPLIELIDVDQRNTQALILAPTRELAQQIAVQIKSFAQNIKNLNIATVYGGASITSQISELKRGAQIVVATPGRLIDLSKRRAVDLGRIKYLVLDEADEMLNMGFKDELDIILAQTPKEKVTWLFSATMPAEIKRLVKNYMTNPYEVRVTGSKVNVNIDHQYSVLKASDKVEALRRLLDFDPEMYGVVFCRTKNDTRRVAEELVETGYAAEPLHGDLSQSQRDAAMKRFRSGTLQLLIATDVAARGIDVTNLTHVVHFALPDDPENYTHRSGRTARAGKKGVSLSLITKGEVRKLKYLESKLNINFTKALIPSVNEVAANRVMHWATKLAEQKSDNLDPISLESAQKILQDFSKDELVAKLVSLQLEKISSHNTMLNINDSSSFKETKGGRAGRGEPREGRESRGRGDEGMQRYFINVGRIDNMNTGSLLRFVCDNSGLSSKDIGRISLEQKHAYIDIHESAAGKAQSLNTVKIDGRELRINRDSDGGPRQQRGGKKLGAKKRRK